jgi:hypothetical protein
MNGQAAISLELVCAHFRVEPELVRDFSEFGLFPIVAEADAFMIGSENLARLAEIVRLHESLGVNKEGIEVILSLREKIAGLRAEVDSLMDEVAGLRRLREAEDAWALPRYGPLVEILE